MQSMKHRKTLKHRILWILSCLPLAMTLAAIHYLPDAIPMHFNIMGEVDRMGSKYELFGVSAVTLLCPLILELYAYISQKNQNGQQKDEKKLSEYARNYHAMCTIGVSIAAFLILIQALIIGVGLRSVQGEAGLPPVLQLMTLAIGAVLMIIGNELPRTRRNALLGIRLSWTMYNDVTWAKSNRFCGIALIVSGILMMIGTIFLTEVQLLFFITLLLTAAIAFSMLYAYHVYREERNHT